VFVKLSGFNKIRGMKIISKFRDYYDSAGLVYGVDDSVLYKRNKEGYEEVKLLSHHKELLLKYAKDIPRYCKLPNSNITPMVIGFCGKLYSAWSFSYTLVNRHYECVFTTAEQFNKFLLANKLRSCIEEFNKNKVKGESNKKDVTAWAIEEWVVKNSGCVVTDDLFLSLKAPIFSCYIHNYWGCKGLKTNTCLKDLGFPYLVDSLSAFNQIAMYLGRLTNPEVLETTTGDEKVLLKKNGFYEKSFKQTAPTKKEKRKLNKSTKRR
jgi:hypothetical protein